jgi:uncharacterized 2Fe-2S/4Fe-4S cluster protein (DUF4445 family)
MAEYTVTVEYNSTEKQFKVQKGTILLDALGEEERAQIDTPCGGKGICGKCKVTVIGEVPAEITAEEKKKLSEKELESGVRLACMTKVEGDIRVILASQSAYMQILEMGIEYKGESAPCVQKQHVSLSQPSLEDQRDDYQRLAEQLEIDDLPICNRELSKLPELLREQDFEVTAVYNQQEILTVEPGDTSSSNYGVAVDIGTTTVVAYLADLGSGKKIDIASDQNKQKAYGQDVISRINHTMKNEDGLDQLQDLIVSQINDLIHTLVKRNKVELEHVYSVILAGNTTMIHLATGLPPRYISTVPFIPVRKKRMLLSASELGIEIAENGRVYVLPMISGYIGADIVGAILASQIYQSTETNLLIDIGTNGEIVMGNKDGLVSCSTAAGPAFEGATIRHGVGGITGAINTMEMGSKDLVYTTIGDKKPIGICGSGIVDSVSTLLFLGIIDQTGRIVSEDEISTETGKMLSNRLTTVDNEPAVILATSKETGKEDIVLTQRDVREIQNVKASIAAGILTLIKHTGLEVEDIDHVYLAGGFGSYINRIHAVNLGLIPSALEERITVIGNAAGSGAMMALISKNRLFECDRIGEETEYVELSSLPQFQEDYVNCMFFGDTV